MKRDAQELFRLARTALENAGAHSRMAEATARHLVQAETQGLPPHDPGVRLPGARRFAAEISAAKGIEVPDALVAQIEKLCSMPS